MNTTESTRMRCLARIATLGGLARPDSAGTTYRLTLNLIEDASGTPIDGTLETRFKDFDDRLEEALVDAEKIWVEFRPTKTERYNPTGGRHARSPGQRLRILEAEDIELKWDEESTGRHQCPDCHGTGEIDLSIGPPRIVDCERCNGLGFIDQR
jgi:hypothetical protein